MLDEDKNFGGSLVPDLRIWWRHVKSLHDNDYLMITKFLLYHVTGLLI